MKKSVRFSDPIEQPSISEQKEVSELKESCEYLHVIIQSLSELSEIAKKISKQKEIEARQNRELFSVFGQGNNNSEAFLQNLYAISEWTCQRLFELHTIDLSRNKITNLFHVDYSEIVPILNDIAEHLDQSLKSEVDNFVHRIS
jgi:hypothetical protein